MGRGGKVLISPSSRQKKEVIVVQPGELGKGATVSPLYGLPAYLKPDDWYKVRVKVTEKGMGVWIEDTKVFEDKSKYDLNRGRGPCACGLDGWVKVESLTVDGGKWRRRSCLLRGRLRNQRRILSRCRVRQANAQTHHSLANASRPCKRSVRLRQFA